MHESSPQPQLPPESTPQASETQPHVSQEVDAYFLAKMAPHMDALAAYDAAFVEAGHDTTATADGGAAVRTMQELLRLQSMWKAAAHGDFRITKAEIAADHRAAMDRIKARQAAMDRIKAKGSPISEDLGERADPAVYEVLSTEILGWQTDLHASELPSTSGLGQRVQNHINDLSRQRDRTATVQDRLAIARGYEAFVSIYRLEKRRDQPVAP